MPKRSVTISRNARSSSAEMCGHDPEIGGHDGPKYARSGRMVVTPVIGALSLMVMV
jgi:hypothetical protein